MLTRKVPGYVCRLLRVGRLLVQVLLQAIEGDVQAVDFHREDGTFREDLMHLIWGRSKLSGGAAAVTKSRSKSRLIKLHRSGQ